VIIFAKLNKKQHTQTDSNLFFAKRTTNSKLKLFDLGGRVMALISVLHLSSTHNKSTYLPCNQPPTDVADMARP
jgi:hypothetical protein